MGLLKTVKPLAQRGRYNFLSIVLCFFSVFYCNSKPINASNSYEVVQPAAPEAYTHVLKWIEEHNDDLQEKYGWNGLYSDCYHIDINNDGKKEYVFVGSQGTTNYLAFYVVIENKNGFEYLDELSDFWGSYAFINPLTLQEELFVRVNNITYMCTSMFMSHGTRNIYKFDGNSLENFIVVCDDYWIKQQRKLFQALYDRGFFGAAYRLLSSFELCNRSAIDPQTDLWIRNDLALAALKDAHPRTGLSIINSIKYDTAFGKAPVAFKKAVEHNQKLLEDALEKYKKGIVPVFDFAWLSTYYSKDYTIFSDGRFCNLLSAIVPELAYNHPKHTYEFDREYWRWKDDILQYFIEEWHDTVEISKDKCFFSASGHIPHCRSLNDGFIWCDLVKCYGVVAITENREQLTVMSRSLEAKDLPKEFFDNLIKWCRHNGFECKEASFYDRLGQLSLLNLTQYFSKPADQV